MKILLLAPSYYPQVNASYFPLGLSYVGAYAKARGHDVDGLNLNHYPDPERYRLLRTTLAEGGYDVVGLTGLTVCFNEIERLVGHIREVDPQLPVVLGGGITSCEAELVMRTIKPDYMVVNEGEVVFINLLKAIAGEVPAAQVGGIWYWLGDVPFYTGRGPEVDDLDTLDEPDLDLMGIKRHIEIQGDAEVSYHLTRYDVGKSLPVLASRSCPFKCTFCHHAGMGKYKRHSIPRVVDQIERFVKKYDLNCVSIYDELFSANRKRVQEFCKLLLERKLNIRWFCQLRVDQLDQELLDLMKKAGCNYISYGFESGSDTVLASMRKKITAADIAHAVRMSRQARIGFQANFLFGDPAETVETLQESLRFQQENQLYFNDWSAVIPYAGTQIFDYAFEKGLIKNKLEFIRAQCNISDYLYRHQLNMTQMSDADYKSWYIRLREINDLNHRKRLAIVKAAKPLGHWKTLLTLECPSCRQEIVKPFRYPLDATDDGRINRNGAVGMLGVNILCPECCRKMHLMPKQIPNVAAIFERFQRRLDRLKTAGKEVVVIPAMDRYFAVFNEDIALDGLKVRAVLDSREFTWGTEFLGCSVARLDAAALTQHRQAAFVILPWIEYTTALELLAAAGVADEAILSWNRDFDMTSEVAARDQYAERPLGAAVG